MEYPAGSDVGNQSSRGSIDSAGSAGGSLRKTFAGSSNSGEHASVSSLSSDLSGSSNKQAALLRSSGHTYPRDPQRKAFKRWEFLRNLIRFDYTRFIWVFRRAFKIRRKWRWLCSDLIRRRLIQHHKILRLRLLRLQLYVHQDVRETIMTYVGQDINHVAAVVKHSRICALMKIRSHGLQKPSVPRKADKHGDSRLRLAKTHPIFLSMRSGSVYQLLLTLQWLLGRSNGNLADALEHMSAVDVNNVSTTEWAIRSGHDHLLPWMLVLGDDINRQDAHNGGNTLMHVACFLGQRACMRVLLHMNANIWIKNDKGQFCWEVHSEEAGKQLEIQQYIFRVEEELMSNFRAFSLDDSLVPLKGEKTKFADYEHFHQSYYKANPFLYSQGWAVFGPDLLKELTNPHSKFQQHGQGVGSIDASMKGLMTSDGSFPLYAHKRVHDLLMQPTSNMKIPTAILAARVGIGKKKKEKSGGACAFVSPAPACSAGVVVGGGSTATANGGVGTRAEMNNSIGNAGDEADEDDAQDGTRDEGALKEPKGVIASVFLHRSRPASEFPLSPRFVPQTQSGSGAQVNKMGISESLYAVRTDHPADDATRKHPSTLLAKVRLPYVDRFIHLGDKEATAKRFDAVMMGQISRKLDRNPLDHKKTRDKILADMERDRFQVVDRDSSDISYIKPDQYKLIEMIVNTGRQRADGEVDSAEDQAVYELFDHTEETDLDDPAGFRHDDIRRHGHGTTRNGRGSAKGLGPAGEAADAVAGTNGGDRGSAAEAEDGLIDDEDTEEEDDAAFIAEKVKENYKDIPLYNALIDKSNLLDNSYYNNILHYTAKEHNASIAFDFPAGGNINNTTTNKIERAATDGSASSLESLFQAFHTNVPSTLLTASLLALPGKGMFASPAYKGGARALLTPFGPAFKAAIPKMFMANFRNKVMAAKGQTRFREETDIYAEAARARLEKKRFEQYVCLQREGSHHVGVSDVEERRRVTMISPGRAGDSAAFVQRKQAIHTETITIPVSQNSIYEEALLSSSLTSSSSSSSSLAASSMPSSRSTGSGPPALSYAAMESNRHKHPLPLRGSMLEKVIQRSILGRSRMQPMSIEEPDIEAVLTDEIFERGGIAPEFRKYDHNSGLTEVIIGGKLHRIPHYLKERLEEILKVEKSRTEDSKVRQSIKEVSNDQNNDTAATPSNVTPLELTEDPRDVRSRLVRGLPRLGDLDLSQLDVRLASGADAPLKRAKQHQALLKRMGKANIRQHAFKWKDTVATAEQRADWAASVSFSSLSSPPPSLSLKVDASSSSLMRQPIASASSAFAGAAAIGSEIRSGLAADTQLESAGTIRAITTDDTSAAAMVAASEECGDLHRAEVSGTEKEDSAAAEGANERDEEDDEKGEQTKEDMYSEKEEERTRDSGTIASTMGSTSTTKARAELTAPSALLATPPDFSALFSSSLITTATPVSGATAAGNAQTLPLNAAAWTLAGKLSAPVAVKIKSADTLGDAAIVTAEDFNGLLGRKGHGQKTAMGKAKGKAKPHQGVPERKEAHITARDLSTDTTTGMSSASSGVQRKTVQHGSFSSRGPFPSYTQSHHSYLPQTQAHRAHPLAPFSPGRPPSTLRGAAQELDKAQDIEKVRRPPSTAPAGSHAHTHGHGDSHEQHLPHTGLLRLEKLRGENEGHPPAPAPAFVFSEAAPLLLRRQNTRTVYGSLSVLASPAVLSSSAMYKPAMQHLAQQNSVLYSQLQTVRKGRGEGPSAVSMRMPAGGLTEADRLQVNAKGFIQARLVEAQFEDSHNREKRMRRAARRRAKVLSDTRGGHTLAQKRNDTTFLAHLTRGKPF